MSVYDMSVYDMSVYEYVSMCVCVCFLCVFV